jgi:hypothetical protein
MEQDSEEQDSEEQDSEERLVRLIVVLTVLVTKDRKNAGPLVERLLLVVETILLLVELLKL